ncbi:MAG: hypothetical protein CNLJKLNK_00709 [Holosporales bacterium]
MYADLLLSFLNHLPFKVTLREIDVLSCLMSGKSTKTSAYFLNIEPKTFETHVANLRNKFDFSSKDRLIEYFEKGGYRSVILQHYDFLQKESILKNAIKAMHFPERKNIKILVPKDDACARITADFIRRHLEWINVNGKIIEDPQLPLKKIKILAYKGEVLVEDQNQSFEGYFNFLVDLYSTLVPQADFEKIKNDLKNTQTHREFFPFKKIRKKSKGMINVFIIMLIILFLGLYSLFDAAKRPIIHYNCNVPLSPLLIRRSDILEKLEYVLTETKIAKNNPIVTSALIGVSGSGKTTIARMYAKKYSAAIIWEFNGQNAQTLFNSYMELATTLAKTEKEKKDLEFITYIKDPQQKRIQLMNFIQNFTRENPKWLFVFDNVDSMTTVELFLPQNAALWGEGRIIITSTNATLKDAPCLPEEQCIAVGSLSNVEAASLFCQICFRKQFSNLTKKESEALYTFLKQIPPFPLDIALCAHYIKNTGLSYDQYVEKLLSTKNCLIQKNLLNETLLYERSRETLIEISYKKIMEAHKDFQKLLLFISVINFKDIPKALLLSICPKDVVDFFILTLKQYSLLSENNYQTPNGIQLTVSLHPGLQLFGYKFLKQSVDKKQEKIYLDTYIDVFKKYSQQNPHEAYKLSNLADHLDVFFDHFQEMDFAPLEKNKILLDLHVILAQTKFLGTRQLKDAKRHYQQALHLNSKLNTLSQSDLVSLYLDLGAIHIDMVEPQNALNAFKTGLTLFKEKDPFLESKYIFNMGYACALLNNVTLAKKYFDQSLLILETVPQTKETIGFKSMVLGMKGWFYAATYLNRSDESLVYSQKALDCLEDSKDIEKQSKISRYVSYAYTTLGDIYAKRGEYDKALKEGFRKTQFIIDHDLDQKPHHFLKIYVGIGHGECCLRMGQLNQAERILKDTIKKGQFLLGKESPMLFVPCVLLMETYLRLSQLQRCEKELVYLLNMNVFEQTMHTRFIDCLLHYNGAILYKEQRDFQKCHHFFITFLHKIKNFLKDFLPSSEYEALVLAGKFTPPADFVDADLNLKSWIDQCKVLLNTVYKDTYFYG